MGILSDLLRRTPRHGDVLRDADGEDWIVQKVSLDTKELYAYRHSQASLRQPGEEILSPNIYEAYVNGQLTPRHRPPITIGPTEPTTAKDARKLDRAQQALANATNLRQRMADGPPVIRWRVKNLIPERGVTVIGADAGSYKTYLAQHLGLAVSTGCPFLEQFETEKGNVLYVDEENGQVLLLRRFGQLAEGHEIAEYPDNLHVLVFEGLKLDTEEGAYILAHLVRTLDIGLVILDSMVRLMQGDEDKATEVRSVFDNIKDVMEATSCSFVILHHTRKDDRRAGMHSLRGSGDFGAMADVVLMLSPNQRDGTVRVTIEKHRHLDLSQVQPFSFRVSHAEKPMDECVRLAWDGVTQEPLNRKGRCVEDFKEWLRERNITQFSSADAKAALNSRGHSSAAYDEARQDLISSGIIVGIKRGIYGVVKELLTVETIRVNSNGIKDVELLKSDSTPAGMGVVSINPHPKGVEFGINETTSLLAWIEDCGKDGASYAEVQDRFPGCDPLINRLVERGDLYRMRGDRLGVLK